VTRAGATSRFREQRHDLVDETYRCTLGYFGPRSRAKPQNKQEQKSILYSHDGESLGSVDGDRWMHLEKHLRAASFLGIPYTEIQETSSSLFTMPIEDLNLARRPQKLETPARN
jgi:hypothetical protein